MVCIIGCDTNLCDIIKVLWFAFGILIHKGLWFAFKVDFLIHILTNGVYGV